MKQPSEKLTVPPAQNAQKCFFQIIFITAIILIGIIIYSNSMQAPIVLDGIHTIIENPGIRFTELKWEQIKNIFNWPRYSNRVLPMFSFGLNYYFGGYSLFGYHIFNLIIHLLAGIFLFLFIQQTLKIDSSLHKSSLSPEIIAFMAAAIWLAHPLQTNTVTYIIQRMTSMAGMFFILSCLLYAKGRVAWRKKEQKKLKAFVYLISCALAGICAMASKEIAGMLPIILLIYEWVFFQKAKISLSKRKITGIVLLGCLFFGITLLYLGESPLNRLFSGYSHRAFSLPERLMTESRVVIYYISLIVFPLSARLNLDYDFPLSASFMDPPTTLLCLSAICMLFLLTVYKFKSDKLIIFSILWFFANLAIESTIIPLEIIFEHRTYLPSMMMVMLIVLLISRTFKKKWMAYTILTFILITSMTATYQRNIIWKNEISLWTDCIKKSPDKARIHNILGVKLYEAGLIEQALIHYKKALEIEPFFTSAHLNLGNALAQQGQLQSAIQQYKTVIAQGQQNIGEHDDFLKAHNNLANRFAELGQEEKAIYHYNEVLRINPDFTDAYYNLGVLYARRQAYEMAIQSLQKTLFLKPDHLHAHINLGTIFADKGQLTRAISHYQKALSINPTLSDVKENLKRLSLIIEKRKQAIGQLNRQITADPKNALLYQNLGNIYMEMKNWDSAIDAYKNAASLRPGFIDAMYNLSLSYAANKNYEKQFHPLKPFLP